jgi:hypothetical protein
MLETHTQLTQLFLYCNVESTRVLAALGNLTNLRALHVADMSLEEFPTGAWATVGAALRKMKRLQTLSLVKLSMPALVALATGPNGEATFRDLGHSLKFVTVPGVSDEVMNALRAYAPLTTYNLSPPEGADDWHRSGANLKKRSGFLAFKHDKKRCRHPQSRHTIRGFLASSPSGLCNSHVARPVVF